MTDVLVHGDSIRMPMLRHELPVAIPDPFLYVEAGGARHAVIGSMEIPRLVEAGGVECHPNEEFGIDELIRGGSGRDAALLEVHARAVAALGVRRALVPFGFPLGLADRLRADGVELVVDEEHFRERRRVKTETQLAGIRRAQRAAEAGIDTARELFRGAEAGDGLLVLDGEPLTVERVKAAMSRTFAEHGCTADEFIVSHGGQSAIGHHMGAGPIRAGEPIVIDVWPRDNETACFSDMTRTYCVGEIPGELREWHRLVKESFDASLAAIRAGASCRAVYDASCEPIERAGHPTQRTKTPGRLLEEGFFHGLGHGVGLEVHEEPGLGIASQQTLLAGDVVTLEPGVYRPGTGGVRLEDTVLVTDDGAVDLTDYPYDLEP